MYREREREIVFLCAARRVAWSAGPPSPRRGLRGQPARRAPEIVCYELYVTTITIVITATIIVISLTITII